MSNPPEHRLLAAADSMPGPRLDNDGTPATPPRATCINYSDTVWLGRTLEAAPVECFAGFFASSAARAGVGSGAEVAVDLRAGVSGHGPTRNWPTRPATARCARSLLRVDSPPRERPAPPAGQVSPGQVGDRVGSRRLRVIRFSPPRAGTRPGTCAVEVLERNSQPLGGHITGRAVRGSGRVLVCTDDGGFDPDVPAHDTGVAAPRWSSRSNRSQVPSPDQRRCRL